MLALGAIIGSFIGWIVRKRGEEIFLTKKEGENLVRRDELDGFGRRVDEIDKRVDAFVYLTDGIRERADLAVHTANDAQRDLKSHIDLMDEKLKALPKIEAMIGALDEKLDRLLMARVK